MSGTRLSLLGMPIPEIGTDFFDKPDADGHLWDHPRKPCPTLGRGDRSVGASRQDRSDRGSARSTGPRGDRARRELSCR
ncbi:hypothetical protein THIOKS12540027 [Thiocapsa sp. KS1]|nr:hypothetical protein THIOKS12540027 [Thiocapsa sp. KS1]